MPSFPEHTDHSFESPRALDRFNQHSTDWKRDATFDAFRRTGQSVSAGIGHQTRLTRREAPATLASWRVA